MINCKAILLTYFGIARGLNLPESRGFSTTVNTNLFTAIDPFTSKPREGRKFFVDSNGRLIYNYADLATYSSFVLKAYGNIRPGDDIILRLRVSLTNAPAVETNSGSFMAIYDKMMLWRANSYIHEIVNHETGAVIDGVVDWNDANQWSGNNGNEWMNGGLGGQMWINSWTRFDDSAGENAVLNAYDNGEVYGSVAYSWGGCDSPMHFNDDMIEQKRCLKAYYRNVNDVWTNFYPNLPEAGIGNGDVWDFTTSPNRLWSGYIQGAPIANDPNFIWNPIVIENDPNSPYYPFLPNFATVRYFLFKDYQSIHTTYSAGTDCSGFIQRAASYSNNPYTTVDLNDNRLPWFTTPWVSQGKADPVVWNIAVDSADRNLIVPGDVLIVPGHIAMVLKITYSANTREILPANVTLIEAAYAGGRYMVVNDQTWGDDYPLNAAIQTLGRLITNQ